VSTSRVKNVSLVAEDGPGGFPDTSVRNYHSMLRTQPRRAQISAGKFLPTFRVGIVASHKDKAVLRRL
jgi:hypothetical protein